MTRVVYVIAGATPAVLELEKFLQLLQHSGFDTCVILTPTAATWVDADRISEVSGHPVRIHPRLPHETDPLPKPDAVVAVPLTFNSINKWAAGISDTLALGLLNEAIGLGIPIVAAPVVSPKLRKHPAYDRSVATLTSAGVVVMDAETVRVERPDAEVTAAWPKILSTLSAL